MAQDIGSAWSRQRAFLVLHPSATTANADHVNRKFLDIPYASLDEDMNLLPIPVRALP
jgi:hypothetical protein